MTDQLNMLGLAPSEAPTPNAAALAPSQREIMRLARRPEGVTAAEAGRVIHNGRNGGAGCRPEVVAPDGHRYRPLPASQAATDWRGTRPDACCPWMSSDGWSALKRLRERGLIVQPEPRGPYFTHRPTEQETHAT